MATIHESVMQEFDDMKFGKGARPRFILLRMGDGGVCQITHRSAPDATYEEFQHALSETEACFAVVGIQFQLPSGAHRSKLVWFNWIPALCPRTEVCWLDGWMMVGWLVG